ncbi:YecA family protein [Cohnella zeiphila]|uniref:SEC-C domain-containing protein n=1 Tax=Cohnella zeiphila TaxID=2761120 RepID=A0A7X0VY38_9BACL|nr:SEC-C metal-binding domain-containing protein [Cohnella zeiphila]MBB6734275.1 SEC-C domain-containing protein [Cohnella zeiphila]
MDRKEGLNKQEQKQIAEAWERFKEDEMRREERKTDSRWVPIEAPLSLAAALARLTKTELSDIRTNGGLRGASSLKKQELADKLAETLPERLGPLLETFDEERFELLKRAASRPDGSVEAPEDEYKAVFLAARGLLFPGTLQGKRVLVMPREMAQAFRGLDASAARKAQENGRLVKLARGMLCYYGVLNPVRLAQLLEPHAKAQIQPTELKMLLDEALDYAGGGLQSGEFGFADEAVVDPERVVEEHQLRGDLPYRPFSTEELLRAGADDFVDRTPAYRELVNFLTDTYDISKEEADEYVCESGFELLNGAKPSAIVEYYHERFEMADESTVGAFVDRIMKLMNGTRLWALKGHMPSELSAVSGSREEPSGRNASGSVIDFATGRKVGRNDPCPCGSGKKFKKCCGG